MFFSVQGVQMTSECVGSLGLIRATAALSGSSAQAIHSMAECFLIHTGIIVWPFWTFFGCCTSAAEAHEFLATVPLPKATKDKR